MEKKSTLPELLAPAGNLETALAAFDAGADAVYGGLVKFNARERAANFSSEELGKLLSYAHGCGRRVYLTFNTLLREQELDEAAEFLAGLARLRPDALIVQDLAVVELCRSYFPQLVLHASTQMGIHNSAGVAAAAALGIRRVILERQVTLEELRRIAAVSPVELEVFVHGSLCCSLSGRCLLSSALGGWSGNRGKCKQPCRRCYEAGKRHGFLLSPKDLEGVELLPEFRRLGIASLKIEGRLRGPEYVWKTVRAYRMLLDSPGDRTVEEEARQLLRSTATRRPSNRFFRRDELGRLIDFERPGVFGVRVGTVGKVSRAGLSVRTEGRLHLGDRLRLVPPDGGEGNTFSLISLRFRGMDTVRVRAGAECFLPGSFSAVPGSLLYKIGENGFDFSRRASTLPAGRRAVTVTLRCSAVRWEGRIDGVEERWLASVDFAPARQRPLDAATVEAEFAAGVPEPWEAAPVHAEVEGAFFVPSSTCRELRRNFWEWNFIRKFPPRWKDSACSAGILRSLRNRSRGKMKRRNCGFPLFCRKGSCRNGGNGFSWRMMPGAAVSGSAESTGWNCFDRLPELRSLPNFRCRLPIRSPRNCSRRRGCARRNPSLNWTANRWLRCGPLLRCRCCGVSGRCRCWSPGRFSRPGASGGTNAGADIGWRRIRNPA